MLTFYDYAGAAVILWLAFGSAAINVTSPAHPPLRTFFTLLGGPFGLYVAYSNRRCPQCRHPLQGRYCSNPIRIYSQEAETAETDTTNGCSANHRNGSVVLSWANWASIRWIGELSILNRVSYLILAIAPLLAVSWLGIRSQVMTFNGKAVTVANEMKATSNEIKENIIRLKEDVDAKIRAIPTIGTETKNSVQGLSQEGLRDLTNRLDSLEKTIDKFTKGHEPGTLGIHFPDVLTISYFAALVLAVAHFLYQAGAPKTIREFTSEEFQASEIARFKESNGGAEQLYDALRTVYRYDFKFYQRATISPFRRPARLLPEQLTALDKFSVIERAAQLTYKMRSSRRPGTAFAATCTYAAGIALIVWITCLQVHVVLVAKGIMKQS